VLSLLGLPIPTSTIKYEFGIMPSLTWAPPQLEFSLLPVLEEIKENIPPSCQRAQVHNPHQRLRMHFKTLWKDACKEFGKEEACDLFMGIMNKSFVSPC